MTDDVQDRPDSLARSVVSKVPEATGLFWITKVLTTGMGETASDFFATALNPVLVVGVTGLLLAISLIVQFRTDRYVPWVYWAAVVMVSVFGTMASDALHVILGIPYAVTTVVFAVCLVAVFVFWRQSEKTLSIHSIVTRRREGFYWVAVLTTFALGTSAGDLTATVMHLGYLTSAILFAAVIAVPALAHSAGRMGPVSAFWFAYVVTRPLGASVADWVAVSHDRGGLGAGTGWVTLVMTVVIVGLVGYLSRTHVEITEPSRR
ncbi:COG4705 family protein [Rhodococcus sp. OK302]|uniref:COG4705 family protein n=1 Tax=Rhodococcus sp. OK302 TaxID=1882769 RepID=UPI000B941455|nr:hypothetical protein [Rhodococcus sp. OK302]OYD67630.1 putative membrane-anchored protein [Rhodococcus sp. OK302]